MDSYLEGNLVHLPATFTDEYLDELADPDTVTVACSVNGGSPTDYSVDVVRVSAGVYYVDVDTTGLPGDWVYQWSGSGTVQAVAYGEFLVESAPL